MSYDAWKTRSDWDEDSNRQIADRLQSLVHEIEWLTGRLTNLSLSEEDFNQTQDYLFELWQEHQSLTRCCNV